MPETISQSSIAPTLETTHKTSEFHVDSWSNDKNDAVVRRAAKDPTTHYSSNGQKNPTSSPIGILPGPEENKLLPRSLTLEKGPKKTAKLDTSKGNKQENVVPLNNTEVIAQVGGTATLSCYTGHISDELVSILFN